jgi:hypothetical protein
MVTLIGICAGKIWNWLDAHSGNSSLDLLFSEVEAPREVILMALGWLAREGHVQIHGAEFLHGTVSLKNFKRDGSNSDR